MGLVWTVDLTVEIKLCFQISPAYFSGRELISSCARVIVQARVVQRLDNAIHRINHYPVDSMVCFVNTYPLDSDLSGG